MPFDMKKELRQIDRDVTNGLDFDIAERVGGLIKMWFEVVGEETTFCPDVGAEYEAWIIPAAALGKLPRAKKAGGR